ncbi:ATP-binding protein [Paenibacillus sp. NPDC056579]|uniref:ATP-binding protein n=1 Tax=unclassified Paenibacillus TaxID=185978 RepID=UPI001EF848C3|nr:ATP-binding protein [Paenibacillus sp. H1-7]ULL18495.1 GHKL domain-containing protein [Paenibacillus sp. H1-7]
MNLLKDLMLQLFFSIIPFIIFNIYYQKKTKNFSRIFIAITSSICMLTSMTFSASVVEGIIFDIRYVILFFAIVFGGFRIGLLLLAELVAYRFYLGGEGTWVAMIIVACSFLASIPLSTMYRKSHRKKWMTVLTGIVISIIPLTFTCIFFLDYVKQHLTFHLLIIPAQNCLGLVLLMSLFSKSVSDKELFIQHARMEKMEAMSHVAASLAHEVRNPLTAVKGFLKLIRESPKEYHKVRQYIDICMDEILRTEAILSEYLSITKPPANRHELINFSEQLYLVSNVMTPFATMHNVELEVQPADTLVRLTANPDEIKQVLVNFIKNAVEACTDISDGKVTLTLRAEEKNAILLIRDNGIGMNQEQIDRLGSIYFSNKTNGTGLGLTYSYHVIHALGGMITVSSKPKAGTTFKIAIPFGAPN